MQPVTRIVGNESITTDQDGGVTPVIDQLWGVRNQSLALDSYREPATLFMDNYTQAEKVTLPLAYGSPSGVLPKHARPHNHPSPMFLIRKHVQVVSVSYECSFEQVSDNNFSEHMVS